MNMLPPSHPPKPCQALTPFGAEVQGLPIASATAADIAWLQQILAAQGVLVLRGAFTVSDTQTSRDALFTDFLQQFGPLTFTQGETPVPGHAMLNCVSNAGRSTPPKSVFHTDTSYVRLPPATTALRAVALPQSGGDTVFSSQYIAYDTLPVQVKQRLADAQVLHQVSGLPAEGLAETEAWHRLFKAHPVSGRTALFLSTPQRCQALTGFAAPEAQRILRLLYRHSIRPYRLYHHRWQANDVLLWDNRCTMHRGDHAKVIGERVFHRGMVLPRV